MNHSIRQYRLEAEMSGTEAESLTLQRLLSQLTASKIIPVLEQTFDRCSVPDAHLYLDSLVIDAGTIDYDRLAQELPEKIAESLAKSLLDWVSVHARLETDDASIANYKSKRQSVEQALLFFLVSGRLPWSFKLLPEQSLEQRVLEVWQDEDATGHPGSYFIRELMAELKNENVRTRLLNQFSLAFCEVLLALLSDRAKAVFDEVIDSLVLLESPIDQKNAFVRQLLEGLLVMIASDQRLSVAALINKSRILLTDQAHKSEDWLPWQQWLEECWPGKSEDIQRKLEPSAEVTLNQHANDADIAEGLYIDNAGLVLLHPFLPQLFEALGIVRGEKIIRPDFALSLLHYLATGQDKAPEYELVLPKLLCQLPLSAPIASLVVLPDYARQEADALLRAVIKHWGALRNTSIDSLRGTFLLRPGKLTAQADGDWRLQVEHQTCDILLDSLPWGLATVKLPWMRPLLWVEWMQ
ncbi:MAG: contractile injection system tape measure protein [Methylicorpusculum sp.]|uniref:contractile injection system tape measure protein n=1 Tax=Methylicorpusculum sp. TaxID=2713644 RepID=UPI00271B7ACE|nr:contractile injection system tape measure protein [Methylicorpusculum sp.]MDO8937584.1 contractile injection system tape measure protein [Methylicorpusculum sp.]MDP2203079.1 contractile injection system tape measure protein [Methylicorpusculum sp.]